MNENTTDPMLQYFQYKHLPERLQEVSKPFGQLAAKLVRTLPPGTERTAVLRKLREAKDCAVTATLPTQTVTVDELA